MQTEVPCFIPAALSALQQYGTSPLWDFMNEPDAGVISPQISMQDMTHKDMRKLSVHQQERQVPTLCSLSGSTLPNRSHEAIIIAEDGQVVRKAFSFRNNCTGYNLLLEQVRRLTLVKSQIVFAMESTAHYWLALYARLLKERIHSHGSESYPSHSCGSFLHPQRPKPMPEIHSSLRTLSASVAAKPATYLRTKSWLCESCAAAAPIW